MMRGIRFPVLAAAVLALASAPVRAQDVFSSGDRCKPAGLGDDPSVCGDSQRIAQTEAQTGSVARVFDGYASQSPQGELGRYLETHGYTAHSGSCLKQPSRVVLFVLNGKVCEANRVGDAFAASDNPNPGGASGGGGQSRPVPIPTPVPGPGPRYIPGPSPNASFGQPKVAGADPCRPFGKGGYDFCQNPKGTRLPAGCSCSNGGGPSNDPGGKGIIVDRKRHRDPPTIMKNPPSDGALFNAINDCLSFIPLNKREFYYYDRPPIQARARKHPGDPPVSYQYGVIYYDQDVMAQQTPATRATLYADAFARHAQALHDKRFGRPEDDKYYDDGLDDVRGKVPPQTTDTMMTVGFIYSCLRAKKLVPIPASEQFRDPRDDFLDAYGLDWPDKAATSTDDTSVKLRAFAAGLREFPSMPVPLLPPKRMWEPSMYPDAQGKPKTSAPRP